MKRPDSKAIFLASAILLLTDAAIGDEAFRPGNGITKLDLLGDGTQSMMVIGRRENFNAHSFDLASLYVQVGRQWQAVTFFDSDTEMDHLTSAGGADCLLHDFRLIRTAPHEPLELVVADRDFGDGFADVQPVVFRRYSLKHNDDELPGRPAWYFELYATQTSLRPYCDVGDAFRQEANWNRGD